MSDQILVTIQDGTLSGVVEKTFDDREFFSFMGIPFAKPPLGDLKFKAPQPIEPWEGIYVANQPEHPCLSKDILEDKIIGDFDCLYLNVYTPQLPKKEKAVSKPVMIMIHGGGFTGGSNGKLFYGCEYFMEKDVVVVVINYRLGVLGFLSLKDEKLGVSGNAALKDQTMGLKWVQKNISAFGGDPNNVTLFGESAGGASVSFHMLSPMSKGLFHKVIIQSGVATGFWAEGDVDLAKELLKAAGKTASSEAEMLQILENLSKEELIAAQLKVPEIWKPCHHRYIGPTIETSRTEENFLPDFPKNILKSGKYNKVPAIIGVVTNEGLLINLIPAPGPGIDYRPVNDAEYCPYSLHVSGVKAFQIGKQIKVHYYGDKEINDKNIQCYYNYVADTFFLRSTIAYVVDVLKTSTNDVYLYDFDLITNLNVLKRMMNRIDSPGVCHGEDLMYLFKTMMSPTVEKNSVEYLAIQKVTTWWTNFAKYSNPNGPSSNNVDSLLDITWPSANVDDLKYMHIASSCTVKSDYCREVAQFWESIEAQC